MKTEARYKLRNPKEVYYMNYQIVSDEEQIEIINEVGYFGWILYEKYLQVAHTFKVNPNLEDKAIAKRLGMKERKVRDCRLKLTKAGLFLRRTAVVNKNKVIFYLIGKETVVEFNQPSPNPSEKSIRKQYEKKRIGIMQATKLMNQVK
jgi:hypothetical protein